MARKRANGEGSIRKRSNGTWEARIITGVDPKSGKMISKSLYGKTQKDVREKMAAYQEEGARQAQQKLAGSRSANQCADDEFGDNLTVGEWLEIFQRDYLADVKPGTAVGYASVIDNHLKPALGKISLRRLRVPMVQQFYNQLREKGLSPKYIKNIHGILQDRKSVV